MFESTSVPNTSLPKRFPFWVDQRSIGTWDNAWLVLVVALDQRLGRTALWASVVVRFFQLGYGFVPAGVLKVPHSHLLHELDFVRLVFRPAHVENVRRNVPCHNLFHGIKLVVKIVATGKFVRVAVPYFDLETVQTGVFAQELNKGDLVRIGGKYHVTRHEKAVEKGLGLGIVFHVVKSSVCRVRGIVGSPIPIVLKDHVVVFGMMMIIVLCIIIIILVVKELQRVFVPYDIDVLKQQIVTQHRYQVDAIHLGKHHFSKNIVSVLARGIFWHGTKYFLIVKTVQPQDGSGKLVCLLISGK